VGGSLTGGGHSQVLDKLRFRDGHVDDGSDDRRTDGLLQQKHLQTQ